MGGLEGVKLLGKKIPCSRLASCLVREERGVYEAKIDGLFFAGMEQDELATTADERGKEKLSDI